MRQIRIPLLAMAISLVAVIGTAVGGAQEKPAPCGAGAVTTDPKGDAFVGFAGNTLPIPADDNQDITNLFFVNDGTTVTANLGIANLSKDMPAGGQGIVYRLFWTYKDVDRFIDVEVTPSGDVTYTHGHFEDLPVGDGPTSGRFHEGPDGVISVRIPPGAGGVPGTKLNAIAWNASTSTGVVLAQSDVIPDSDSVAYAGDQCTGGPTGPAPTATPSTIPTPGPQPNDPDNQPRKVSVTVVKADKATKSKVKKFGLSVAASETLTAVTAQFKKGPKLLGTGKTASLGTKARRVVFKLKKKQKIAKGGYALTVAGKNASGAAQTATAKFKVR